MDWLIEMKNKLFKTRRGQNTTHFIQRVGSDWDAIERDDVFLEVGPANLKVEVNDAWLTPREIGASVQFERDGIVWK